MDGWMDGWMDTSIYGYVLFRNATRKKLASSGLPGNLPAIFVPQDAGWLVATSGGEAEASQCRQN